MKKVMKIGSKFLPQAHRFAIIASLATGVVAASALSRSASASPYPGDYTYQTVRAVSDGPALFVHVGSGILDREIIGYRLSGELARSNPDHIDAVIDVRCRSAEGDELRRVSTVRLGREWHGAGYLSAEFHSGGMLPEGCEGGPYQPNVMPIAFSDGQDNWDSKGGANYRFDHQNIFNDPNAATLKTEQGGSDVNLRAWDFVIDQLRK